MLLKLCVPVALGLLPLAAEVLQNGITLPATWPPRGGPTQLVRVPPYLTAPPAVIPIDTGRQLFVDDFLVEQTTLVRTAHRPVMWPFNPIVAPGAFPDTADVAMPYSDGIWFDPADRLFKMWYFGGYGNMISYAYSADGKNWIKPALPGAAVPGTNMVLQLGGGRDSTTVWMDLEESDPSRKFKLFAYVPPSKIQVYFSPDGIRWTAQPYVIYSGSDRTTVFWNPFRKVWVDSIRLSNSLPAGLVRPEYFSRVRYYAESANLTAWNPADWVSSFWTGPDENDPPYAGPGGAFPELYNLDAVAYESLIVGLFSWFHPGPDYDPSYRAGPNLVELGVGFSRDGFNWLRPTRDQAFIAASNTPGTWNGYNTQSAGGCFLVVGDELWFYFSGRDQKKPLNGIGSTGLATLRRDGFYSMKAGPAEGVLTTRPVKFSGTRLFVNVDAAQGQLRVEALDAAGAVIQPFSKANSGAISVNKTMQEVTWAGAADLAALAGRTVKFRFYLTNGSLFSFWVAPNALGASNGYVAAGGPGFTGPTDTAGKTAMPTTTATPVIVPPGGTFPGLTAVTLTTATVGAAIRYTLDGSDPTAASTLYTGPFTVPGLTTVKARSFADGLTPGGIATASFTVIDYSPPAVAILTPAPGQTVTGPIAVTASASDNIGVAGVQFKFDGANLGAELTAPPYSVTLDTTNIPAGSHTVAAVARDAAGNSTSSAPVTFTVAGDTTPPVVAMVSPAAGARLSRTIAVSATASDNVSVAGLQFQLDGANLQAEFTAPPYSLNIDTTTIANGAHTFRAIARDAAGNRTTSAAVSVTIDNDLVAPVVAMVTPMPGQTVSGMTTVSATASDNVGVAGVQFLVDGANYAAEAVAPPYSVSLDTTKLPNGLHNAGAIARDAYGNRKAVTVSFSILNDVLPPVVALTAPAAGLTIRGSIEVAATASDDVGVMGVQFLVDGAALGPEKTAPPYTVTWDTRTAPNGSHTLSARARDGAGRQATAAAVVQVRNLVLPGAPLAFWSFDPVDVSGNQLLDRAGRRANATAVNATTPAGLSGNALHLEGAGYAAVTTDDHLNLVNDMTLWLWLRTTNANRLEGLVSKFDASGSESGYLLRTNAAGNVGMRFGPSNAGSRKDVVDTRKVNDGTWHHVAAVLKLGSGVTFYIDGAPSTSWPFNLTPAAGGLNFNMGRVPWLDYGNMFRGDLDQVRVYASALTPEEIAGLYEYERTTAPDITAPTVAITAPASGATVSGRIALAASSADNTAVLGVQFRLDGADFDTEKTVPPYTASLDTVPLSNGSHTIAALARDAAGNSAAAPPVTIVVNNDHTPPAVSITSPAASQTVAGRVTLAAAASDAGGVAGVQFLVDGRNVDVEKTAAPFTASLDTATLPDGDHTVAAAARDAAGNRAISAAVTFTVKNDGAPPTVSISAPAPGQTVAGRVTLTASATDNVRVAGVQFLLDGAAFDTEKTTAPYTASLDTSPLANGPHTLAAVARDASGNRATSAAVTFTVNNDRTPPTVSISAPAPGQTVAGSVAIVAAASDNVGVAGVQFIVDGAAFGPEDTTNTFSVTLDTTSLANGPHTITAAARDAAGNRTTSAAVTITVNNDRVPPVVAISSPSNLRVVSGVITVTATASDNVAVAGVQFLVDGVNFDTEKTAPPYTATLTTTSLTNALHTLTAVARDAAGNRTTSAGVAITVNNLPALPYPPLAYWSFDPADISGNQALDRSANLANATMYRTAAIAGKSGGALRFDGVSAYAETAADAHLNLNGDMTAAFWLRTTNAKRYEAVAGKYDAAGAEQGYLIRVTPSGALGVRIGGDNLAGGIRDIVDTARVNDGAWHHAVVVIRLGAGVSFYIDGVPTSTAQRNIIAHNSGQHFNIGRNPYPDYGAFFTGDLDELRVYSRALTAPEAATLYLNGK